MIVTLLLLLLGLAVTAAIIAANGYFVAQEFAYMSVDRSVLRARAEKGDAAARRALAVTRRTSFMLSGAQLGITITGLLVGYVAEPLIGESLGVLLGGVGVPTATGIAIGTVAALAVATVVQMIFGELFPKNLAIAAPLPLSRTLARSTLIYLTVFGWLISLFDLASNALLRLLRVEPVHDLDESATAEDLERIIGDSRDSGDLPADLSLLLDRILDFPDRDVEHAMIPRVSVDDVPPDEPIARVRARMAAAHTRFPVVAGDEAVGVVHLTDVLGTASSDDRPAREIMREPVIVPTLMPLPDAFALLTARGDELACVIDEYGGFAGILTVEDLAEELVGEITDEHDAEQHEDPMPADDGTWTVHGDMHVDELERHIGRTLPRGDYETVAGLAIAEHRGLPEPGEVVRIELPATVDDHLDERMPRRELVLAVVSTARHVPDELRVSIDESDPASPENIEEDDR